MKKPIFLHSLFFTFLISIQSYLTSAQSHLATAEISYEWVSDSTYRFYVKYYDECVGIPMTPSVGLCFTNPCDPTKTFTSNNFTLTATNTLRSNCAAYKNKCDSPGSTLAGYKELLFSKLVVMPARCNAWKVSFDDVRGHGSTNIPSTTGYYHTEVRFNNAGFQGNSSPYFSSKPISYIYNGTFMTYNSGAVDPDSDSLVTELINPQTSLGPCDTGKNTGFVSMSPSLSLPSNPFQTNNTFGLVGSTGQMTFTPGQAGAQNVAIRVKEYRGGVLVGSVMREVQFQVINGSPKVPVATTPSSGYVSGMVHGCINQLLSFTFDIKSADTTAVFFITDNRAQVIPAASMSYTNMYNDSIRVTFNWTPGTTDAGLKTLVISVKDSTCKAAPGIMPVYTITFPIRIWGNITASNDTTICLGDSINLNVKDGNSYTWQVLTGSPGSISCISCPSPKVYPGVATSYRVTSTSPVSCPPYTDVVNVTINSTFTYPSVSISASPDTNIAAGTPVTLNAAKLNCVNVKYKWKVNGTHNPVDTNSSFGTAGLKDKDVVTCEMICKDMCPKPRDTVSNKLTFHVSSGVGRLYNNYKINLFPNPNNGSFTLQALLAGSINTNMQIVNSTGQIVHKATLQVHNGELNESLKLNLPAGVYLLRLDDQAYRFTVADK